MQDFARTPQATRMIRGWALLYACAFTLAHVPAAAGSVFIVNLPWVLPAAKGKTTQAFMNLQSSDGASLVGVRSAVATRVAIIAPGDKGATMQRLLLPRGEEVALAPGKVRLRLDGIQRTLKLGELVPFVLTIEAGDGSRQDVEVRVEVRSHSVLEDELREQHHHQHP
jgi:periplasmic copper chaperone A